MNQLILLQLVSQFQHHLLNSLSLPHWFGMLLFYIKFLCLLKSPSEFFFSVSCTVLAAACGILVVECGIQFPDQELNLGLFHRKWGILATGPPEKSLLWIFIELFPYLRLRKLSLTPSLQCFLSTLFLPHCNVIIPHCVAIACFLYAYPPQKTLNSFLGRTVFGSLCDPNF